MTSITTTAKLRKMNQQIIYHYIYKHKATSKQAIADNLNLSLPTVAQNLKELESMGLVKTGGNFESTGGRKAKVFACIFDARIAIGIAVTKKYVNLSALNLSGETLSEVSYPLPFSNNPTYYQSIGNCLETFIQSLPVPESKILGVGIGLQGLISNDGTSVIYGKILNCTGITLSQFSNYIPFPCYMIHDAEAAATAELWYRKNLDNCVYFYLNPNLGGAVILNGSIYKGQNSRSGLFEHMTVVPNGKQCYCGKCGCLEAYCGADSLLTQEESLEIYFERLRKGNPEYQLRWNDFLQHLALGIDNIHMVMDLEVILGGLLTHYMDQTDMEQLENLLTQNTAFPSTDSYVKTSICNTFEISKGAAILYIKQFLESISELS